MNLSQSKYSSKARGEGSFAADAKREAPRKKATPKEPNNWRDLTISEANVTAALEQFLHQTTHVAKDEDVERIVVGDLAKGFYPLAVLIKRKESR